MLDAEAERGRRIAAITLVLADLEDNFRPGHRSLRSAPPALPRFYGDRRTGEPTPCRGARLTDFGAARPVLLPTSGRAGRGRRSAGANR